ncbi:hypothetical protein ACIQOV_00625, partial [Kitasatospora sp. NPDC091257]|uniref:hypothetical protein n=1 Tax=Kitasatospora sp. NPDC091257 TaxID=3364084 RepID=UPI00381341AE
MSPRGAARQVVHARQYGPGHDHGAGQPGDLGADRQAPVGGRRIGADGTGDTRDPGGTSNTGDIAEPCGARAG